MVEFPPPHPIHVGERRGAPPLQTSGLGTGVHLPQPLGAGDPLLVMPQLTEGVDPKDAFQGGRYCAEATKALGDQRFCWPLTWILGFAGSGQRGGGMGTPGACARGSTLVGEKTLMAGAEEPLGRGKRG